MDVFQAIKTIHDGEMNFFIKYHHANEYLI